MSGATRSFTASWIWATRSYWALTLRPIAIKSQKASLFHSTPLARRRQNAHLMHWQRGHSAYTARTELLCGPLRNVDRSVRHTVDGCLREKRLIGSMP